MKTTVYIHVSLENRIALERLITDRDPEEMLAFLKELRHEVEKAAAG